MALVQAAPQLQLSLFWEGLIGASALIGVFLGGFAGGWFTDKTAARSSILSILSPLVPFPWPSIGWKARFFFLSCASSSVSR
jgi:putative MFS transporter